MPKNPLEHQLTVLHLVRDSKIMLSSNGSFGGARNRYSKVKNWWSLVA